ncbi:MAG: ribosomal protein [Rickettsiales bacterium]|jgi:large subunit ribosomal protein L28|nr:ribosomal protein [Rickettsiales bacterium]
MARRCTITGTDVQTGNKISHSNRKARKRFLPNLQKVSLASEALKSTLQLRITVHTLRSIDKNGGLDPYLLSTACSELTTEARVLKRKIKKALGKKAA